ncbi:hypothetical protein AXK30_08965 [Escherichia coli]|nr:hypothetical protein AXK30_08965 [Escherichia coli]
MLELQKITFCYICKIVRCQKDDKAVTAWVRENGRWGTDKRKIEGLNQTLQITHRFMPDAA